MSQSSRWKILPLKGGSGVPKLLVSTRFTPSSYAVHITDLANIWSESMARKAIIVRAIQEETSIDPSDGEENMTSFLKCLKAALDPAEPNHELTTLSLTQSNRAEAGADDLVLTTSCELPRELSATPLTWHMYLKKGPPSAMTAELILPLVEAQRTQQAQSQSLVDIIHQKDAVITKLLDRLEATGTPLENVFTTLSAKRKVTREEAEGRVRGLGRFRWEEWHSTAAFNDETPDVNTLVDTVFAEGMEYQPSPKSAKPQNEGRWWRHIDGSSQVPEDASLSPVPRRTQTSTPSVEDATNDRPRAPPHKATKARERIENESDEDVRESSPPARARFGVIGGGTHAMPQRSQPITTTGDGSETESEDDNEPVAQRTPNKPVGRIGLGIIGGHALQTSSRSITRSPTPDDKAQGEQPPSPERPARTGGIGIIGGTPAKKGKTHGHPDEDTEQEAKDEPPVNKAEPQPAAPRPVEKRPIVRPAKKKRKF